MTTNISGVGGVFTRRNGLLLPLLASVFTITEEVTSEESKGYPLSGVGPLVTTDTNVAESSWTVNLAIESADKLDLDTFVFNQSSATVPSIIIPEFKVVAVPATSPYEVTEVGLTADQAVEATLVRDSSPGKKALTQVIGATAVAANNFKVASGKITFDASAAGLNVAIYYRKTATSLEAIGGPNNLSVSSVEIFGKVQTSRTTVQSIWLPRCSTASGAAFDVKAGDFPREYKATVPTELGFVLPYMKWAAA